MAYDDAPSDAIFNEIKSAAISIWSSYDDTYGYATSKINQVTTLRNLKDNWGTLVGMFDHPNQMKLCSLLLPEAKKKVEEWL